MKKELYYPEAGVPETINQDVPITEQDVLADEDSDIDVHIVGSGMFTDNDESGAFSAEFIDLDSDGEIDAVLIDVGENGDMGQDELLGDSVEDLEPIQVDENLFDSDIQEDQADMDMDFA